MNTIKKTTQKVDSIKFTYEIILCKGKGKLSNKANTMIEDLVTNAINKKIYKDPLNKQDSIQTSYLNILLNQTSFNPDKTDNAFAYFTEIHKRSTAEFINFQNNKKGYKKNESKFIKTFSINSANNGDGMYNV